jgi:hypothetical protein
MIKVLVVPVLALIILFSYFQQFQPPIYAQTPEVKVQKEAFYCGAITKSGKPCKKRVKKQGEHCWMHQGK